jgi:hypothetical protein
MTGGFLHWGMLAGLAGVSIPLIIHFFNRRRAVVVDWGAMQFLELGRRSTWRLQLGELLLLLGRMLLLGLIALALARPFLSPKPATAAASSADSATESNGVGGAGVRRDVVLVIDGSASMGRTVGRDTPMGLAVGWAKQFVSRLAPGDSTAVILAREKARGILVPASFDQHRVSEALANLPQPRGGGDLPMAIADALRLLEVPGNPARDIIVLTDGQGIAWRSGETSRWAFLRELYQQAARRSGEPPRISTIAFGSSEADQLSNAAVGPLELARGLITPGLPITVKATVSCAGDAPITRTAELRLDDRPIPGLTAMIGPIPPGGSAPLSFETSIESPGSHVLSIRLTGAGDGLPSDDESSRAIEVTAALRVLLVDGDPGTEPLSSETDFLRAALAPAGADRLQTDAKTTRLADFLPGDLAGCRVVVLANVARLDSAQLSAINRLLDSGGGVLFAHGDKVDASFANSALFQGGDGWLPARLGIRKGDSTRREAIAHPSPRTFIGPALADFATGDSPSLAAADLFSYTLLEPAKGAVVVARLDTGDPWIVERAHGRGRVAILAGPIDAAGGTLPVNPDFVPWAHELIFHLADADSQGRNVQPGEPIVIAIDPAPPTDVDRIPVTKPDGTTTEAPVSRAGERAQARLDDSSEPGVYQFTLRDSQGGTRYATVAPDPNESKLEPLGAEERNAIEAGWPFHFEASPERLADRLFAAGQGSGRREVWRYLILAALAGLCMEVWLTRRLVKTRGIADFEESTARDGSPSS